MKLSILFAFVLTLIVCSNNRSQSQPIVEFAARNEVQSSIVKSICKYCNQKIAVPIRYGKPGQSNMKLEKNKEIFLGGCVVGPNAPKYHCYTCNKSW